MGLKLCFELGIIDCEGVRDRRTVGFRLRLGESDLSFDGLKLGALVGLDVGVDVGLVECATLGPLLGVVLGMIECATLGLSLGVALGISERSKLGSADGPGDGDEVGPDDSSGVGALVGEADGLPSQ